MNTVTSKDGTQIAYDKTGQGPAVIVVDGALNYRAFSLSAPIAKQLAKTFTVYTYDRRGRGDSGDTLPYATKREIEDLDVLADAAGGHVCIIGLSSGAILALEAVKRLGSKIEKLALYEAPMILDDSRPPLGKPMLEETKRLIATGKRDEAMKLFMKAIEVPPFMLLIMRLIPTWKSVRKVAHTLAYDLEIASPYQEGKPLPIGQWSNVTVPVWVGVGGKSHGWMINAQKALVEALPNATLHVLPGQTHIVQPGAIVPELEQFLTN